MKYILVTGGVCSGIGKGVVTSSIAKLLQSCGIHVTAIKIDPYINIDAGTFSPYEHGEVYVLDDGSEVDLDLGNYERFLDITLSKDNNLTTGKLDQLVINRERTGDYLGKTVQAIPHKTKEIQEWVKRVAHIPVTKDGQCPEVCVIELGGTIGDIDGMIYVYAFREFAFARPKHEFCCVHVSLVPQLKTSGESKTKPTQKSVSELRQFGLEPDLIICRSENIFEDDIKTKISDSCVIKIEQVICLPDLSSIYKVPIVLEEQKVISFLNTRLQLNISMPLLKTALQSWKTLVWKLENCSNNLVEIALVGKYTKLKDSYASLIKAIQHACIAVGSTPCINYIEAGNLELKTKQSNPVQYHEAWQNLCKSSGVIIPGGFGERGFQGMIEACHWCREKDIPFLGICLGFQTAVVEFARNVLNISDANSIEMENNTTNPIIIEMPEHHTGQMGGTLRLGLRQSVFNRDCILRKLYKKDTIEERHRHRYEVNKVYLESFEKAGLEFVATDLSGERMEVFELKDHRFYLATQFHPEYLSRPLKPSPVFLGFILASLNKLKLFLLKGGNLSPIMISDVDSTDNIEKYDLDVDF